MVTGHLGSAAVFRSHAGICPVSPVQPWYVRLNMENVRRSWCCTGECAD